MILSDQTICELIKSGEMHLDPFDPTAVQPASIDCRLGSHFLFVDTSSIDCIRLNKKIPYKEYVGDTIVIEPHSFLLATTEEYIKVPNGITAFVEGRSSIGRMGLFIQNAGWVDSGFEGCITLELYNANSVPIELQAGRRICQLVFCKMDKTAQNPYNGKYLGQRKSMGSHIYQDVEVKQHTSAYDD